MPGSTPEPTVTPPRPAEETSSPIGHALVLMGDMWSVRIIRGVFMGRRRFQDLRDALKISDPVLSRRLRSLVDDGILVQRTYRSNPPRSEYLLTDAGIDLWRVILAMWTWDRTWAGPDHPMDGSQVIHETCGKSTRPVFGCEACGAIGLTARDVSASVDSRVLLDVTERRSRRSPALLGPMDSAGLLGDRWSTFLLSDALMGSQRFSDFQERLAISPVTLTRRLALFVDSGVLTHETTRSGGKRREYRLTPKGIDFYSVFATINAWAERWFADDGNSGLGFVHRACGQRLQPCFTCNSCNQVLERKTIRYVGIE